MKKHFIISIFCFSFVLLKAQCKINFPLFDPSSSMSFARISFLDPVPAAPCIQSSVHTIYLKTSLPPLPFFCNMEDKFRNKFNIFLKIRAGNDESYMHMITPNKP